MKFFAGDSKSVAGYLIKFFLKVFLKLPGWAKLLTALIFFSFILQAVQGIQNKFQELTQPSPSLVNSSDSSPVSQPATDPFSDGVRKATNAAKLAQTARTINEWNTVASEWQAAINFMKAVSPKNPNYKVAQERILTYPKNLEYAQKNVENLKQKQSKIENNQVIRGEQVFKRLKGIYQVAGQITATPVVRVIIPMSGWNKLSKVDQISLTMYAQSLISIIKSNPAKYVNISPSAPAYNFGLSKTANLCQDCWSIILSYKDTQPYGIDTTVVQGDTPWKQKDPCCRGVQASEFRQ
jgi:hypothetical protein